MSDPFLGEIRMFAGTFAPVGWNFCDGTVLQISGNDALFSLLGSTFGGDGQTTFGLPDLRGRVPVHPGSFFTRGQVGGSETVTLIPQELPTHTHPLMGSLNTDTETSPANNVLGGSAGSDKNYYTDAPFVQMAANAISSVGNSLPHDNLQPFLCVNFIIALAGI